ncbi:MAG: hypothetical protein ACREQY_02620 [Candidatus Binatia bacterium]
MRFLYGLILGVLGTVIGVILYLALGGGEYLLVLSPTHHQMKTRLEVLQKVEEQRDQLAQKLETLEGRFQELARRFAEIQTPAREGERPAAESAPPSPETASPAEADEGGEEATAP